MALDLLQKLGLVQGQVVFITPFTPMSEKLYRDLQEHDVILAGFIDKNKQASNIVHPSLITQLYFDKIIIISPNHELDIYQGLLKEGVKKSVLILIYSAPDYRRISHLGLRLKQYLSKIKPSSLSWLQEHFRGYLHDHKTVLLLAKDFVDLNIKDLYVGLCSTDDLKPIIATDNAKQRQVFHKAGFRVVNLYSWRFIWLCLRAKVKVLDHSPVVSELVHALKYSCSLQIWHGIPLKKIGHLMNYKIVHYNLVVSTSRFVTDYAFSHLFSTDRFIESGYPRNDLLQCGVTDERQLVLVNQPIYQWALQQGKQLIVYMPTWRGDSFESNPMDLDELARFAEDNNIIIIIKMHPFIRANSFFDTLESDKYTFHENYDCNIVFYPSTDDIYPILNISSLLITDYSSVYFDYLFVDKPILFFVYDFDAYTIRHGDFMLDFEKYTPGDKIHNYFELTQSILANLRSDTWQQQRKQLKDMLFHFNNEKSSKQLCNAVCELMLKNKV